MNPKESITHPGQFHTTRWSVVLSARRRSGTETVGADPQSAAHQALAQLCTMYWQPVYSFVRRLGHNPDHALDLTQGFLAFLLQQGHVGNPDPDRGRFRTYLLGALRHYIMDESARAQAIKRGGGLEIVCLLDDRDSAESAEQAYTQTASEWDSPERAYLRRWGLLTLETARQRLRTTYAADGKAELFDALADGLGAPSQPTSMAQRANQLGLSPEALKMALSRLRRRYGETLRQLIAETVDSPDEVDAEIRFLIEAVG